MLMDKGRNKKKKKTHIHNIFTFSVLESSRKPGGHASENASFQVFTYRHFRYELVPLLDYNLKHLLLYTLSEETRNNQKPSDYSTKIPGLLNHLMSTHSCLCHDFILQNPQLPQLLLKLLSVAVDAHITSKSKAFSFSHFWSCGVCYLAQESFAELWIDPTQTLTFTLFRQPGRGMNLQEKHKLN